MIALLEAAGPWEHIINTSREAAGVDFGPQALVDWDGYVCRRLDYHLKGIDNGVLDDPPVYVFVMGRNARRAASDWPLPETQFADNCLVLACGWHYFTAAC